MEDLRALVPTLRDLVAEVERQAGYASALAMEREALSVAVDSQEQRLSRGDPVAGVVFSAWDGQGFQEYATSTLEPSALAGEVRQWLKTLRIISRAGAPEAGPALEQDFSTPVQVDPATVPLRDKFQRVLETQRQAAGLDPRIINARVSYGETIEQKVFVNRTRALSQRLVRTLYSTVLFVRRDGEVRYDWETRGGTRGYELAELGREDLERLRDSAVALLSAERVEPGEYDVVTAPSMTGLVAHESFGHGVELDMFLKGRARAQAYLGRAVAASSVTILDDPSVPGAYGSYFFDDEGQMAGPTRIVENGVFHHGLSDLFSATRLRVARTANGRRESYARKAYPRMTNTFFAEGTTAFDDLIASIDYGVYLVKGSSGMEDPQGWGIQLTCHYGREIRGGKLTDRVLGPIGVTGYVPDLLHSVQLVGRGLELDPGTCGKGHKEMVPVSSGGPPLRLRARLG